MTDSDLITAIAARAVDLYRRLDVDSSPAFIVAATIFIVHDAIIPLRLQEWLDADDVNFVHDIAGINRHLATRPRPHLRDGFMPRFANTEEIEQ